MTTFDRNTDFDCTFVAQSSPSHDGDPHGMTTEMLDQLLSATVIPMLLLYKHRHGFLCMHHSRM